MQESPASASESASSRCLKAIETYKTLGRSIQAPAIRKVFESIIRQKVDQAAAIVALEADPAVASALVAPPDADIPVSDPETMLAAVRDRESAFALALESAMAGVPGEDARHELKALADMSRKFSSWVKDHLDLLALF